MKKITLLCAILLLLAQLTFSQNIIAKRVKISNPTRAELIKIKETGIDLTCGALYIDNNVILEIGEYELNALTEKGISYTVLVDDLMEEAKRRSETELPLAKAQLKEMKAKTKARKSLSTKSTSINNFIQYEGESEVDWAVPQNFNLGSMLGCLTYNEVLAELDQMRALYPNLISVKTDASPGAVTHGNSYTNNGVYDKWEGQPIYYVRISDNPDTDESNEPESLYSGMTHSREVSSMMNLIYYMWYILENYDSDPGIKNLVDNHEMYFIPVANPDGLMWNEQTSPNGNGLQRKNLGPYNTGDHQSRGVDLNRNYNYFWGGHDDYAKGTTGSSPNSPDQTYRGPSAFSEPETQIVRNFSATREFKTAMNHHASSNLIPHAYNGYPDSPGSGREAEYHKFCHDMTRYNRYIYGEAPDILTIANGDMSDWMLGGATDLNGSNGSGQGILALAPENGSWVGSDNEGGFWPSATKIVEIAQRAVRMNLVNAYHSGKFAQFHDLNPSNIAATSGNLEFGLEYLGQTLGDITLNVTPVSSNITSITPPATQSGWSKLEQRTVTAAYTLDAGIQPNDKIEFQISVTNDDGYLMYRANIVKYFNPTILTQDNPDVTGISKWTSSGGAWGTINTTDVFNNSTAAITDSPSGSYSNNQNKTLTYNTSVDLSTSSSAVVQFYAKWDLERNFDYVQIQGSTNGSTWIPLNGKYTKPGSSISTNRYSSANSSNNGTGKSTADQNNQPTGESIYDADTMDKWVMEEILIDATENSALFGASNVQFRFLLNSDNSNRADGYPTNFDGFTFDDFKVISFNDNLPQAITFEPISDKLTISSDFNVSATSNSGLSITYTILSGPATISGNTISLNGTEGTVVVEASQTGNATYNPAESVTRSFEITETYCGEAIVNTFPFNEGFESYFTLWLENSSDDDINWTRKLKENDGDSTPSGGTGPSTSSEGDYFIFTEASGNGTGFPNKEAILESPCFDFSGYENAQLEFDFHMFGADMGKLSLEVSTNNGASYISLFSRDKTTNGNQTANASAWITETIDLSTYDGETIKFRFIGLTGANFTSDMAIDNINITADVVSGFTPVASCQNINATLDGTGNVTITASDLNDGSSVGDLSIDISTFTCANLGTNNVTLTATDPSDSGNTNSCVAVVTVTANKPADDVTNETICSGESYTWSAN
ncbi:M14 family zinc carboxypeptidase, partial [Algibacter pectinivorans]